MEGAARERLAGCATRALEALSSLQRADGHWCGELEGDSILQSEYILMKWILGQERAPMADGRDGWETLQRITRQLHSQQRPDGTWGQYPGSGIDLSATVKGYLCLALMGHDRSAPHMRRAREAILGAGGAERINTFSNIYLACLGQVPWSAIPEIPPEVVWLPRWFPFHLGAVSAWSRTMILPLAIVSAHRPVRRVPVTIDELFVSQALRRKLTMRPVVPRGWRAFFHLVNLKLRLWRRVAGPVRERACTDAFAWIMGRASQDGPAATEGLGAIFPPMVYLQIVFHALGIPRSDARVMRAERDLDAFFIEDGERIRIQPCFSPVWDTGIALSALADCGLAGGDSRVGRAAEWLRSRQVAHVGDWAVNARGGARGAGWAFEYANSWYPDVDDTAMVSMALRRTGSAEDAAAAARGVAWIVSLQNDDGGFAAFDRTRDRPWMEHIPFADHNAIQDPSCPDITGRVLECLAWQGRRVGDASVDRAVAYIRSHQRQEGCFFGRWGVNYLYGTWQSVIGPIRCGVSPGEPWIQRAGAWARSVQQEDGSFGESADSYHTPALKGQGPSTASQTAWGAMILQEIFGPDDPDLLRALEWLARTQLTPEAAADPARNPDRDPAGSWHEPWFTGTGFPEVFYLRYHLYRLYFPLMALGRFLAAHGERWADQKGAGLSNRQRSPEPGCVNASAVA